MFYYGRVIEGLALWEGTKHQYPLYDALAMGMQILSIAAVVAIGHLTYLSVFAPHLVTKVMHLQTVGPSAPLFEGIPNQPL